MRPWVLLVLVGCNRILGIGDVTQRDIDARLYDAPLDAAPTCPATGVPTFRHLLHQIDANACVYYTPTEVGFAVAVCGSQLATGPIGASLTTATFAPPLDGSTILENVRVVPEGDHALAYGFLGGTQQVYALARDPVADTWHFLNPITGVPNIAAGVVLGAPSRGPDHRALAIVYNQAQARQELYELAGNDGAWTVRDMYLGSDLGVLTFQGAVSLTPDGLRLVGSGLTTSTKTGVLYATRPDTASRFGTVQVIDTLPPGNVNDPYLTEDCGTLYFDALLTVLYYQQ